VSYHFLVSGKHDLSAHALLISWCSDANVRKLIPLRTLDRAIQNEDRAVIARLEDEHILVFGLLDV